jgi:hypothetical protein
MLPTCRESVSIPPEMHEASFACILPGSALKNIFRHKSRRSICDDRVDRDARGCRIHQVSGTPQSKCPYCQLACLSWTSGDCQPNSQVLAMLELSKRPWLGDNGPHAAQMIRRPSTVLARAVKSVRHR